MECKELQSARVCMSARMSASLSAVVTVTCCDVNKVDRRRQRTF